MTDPIVKALLEDMRQEAVTAIGAIGALSNEQVAQDPILSRAIALSLVLIGEAASQMPAAFRDRYPNLAWNEARGLRNRIVHGYRTVVPDILIETVRHDLPALIDQIDALLKGQIS